MKSPLHYILVLTVIVVAASLVYLRPSDEYVASATKDHKNATYVIEGVPTILVNGLSEVAVPNSSAKIVTRYFGNELKTDLNGDGLEDVVFLLTQETGGSGVFYYAVAAIQSESGYRGSNGFLLGDRIAPQTTELSRDVRHQGAVVINYADRAPGEPMSAQPSVGKSVYLTLDAETMQWGSLD